MSDLPAFEDFMSTNVFRLPTVKETLRLTTERTNPQDPFAVAVMKDGYKVRHIPRTVLFLRKGKSVGFYEVTGAMVNHSTGFDLEISCVYRFYGCLAYIERLKNLLL